MLLFEVNNQTLVRKDSFDPATDSVEYLKAGFSFKTADWSGYTKTAHFRTGEKSYEMALDGSGACLVPWEVLADQADADFHFVAPDNQIFISVSGVKGVSRITTNEVRVILSRSGYEEGENSEEPTPSVYEQFVEHFDEAAAQVQAFADEIKDYDESIKNSYANAFKGSASGEVIRLDDVSPVEHTAAVKVSGKNLFNYDAFRTVGANNGNVTFSDDGVITLKATGDDCYTQYKGVPEGARIPAKEGDVFTLSWETDATSAGKGLVLILPEGKAADFKTADATSKKMTYTVPKGYTYIVFRVGVATAGDSLKYWGLQVEKGDIATPYVPYIDPTTVQLTACGKNMLAPKGNSGAGYTATLNADGSVTVTGAANTADSIYLMLSEVSDVNPLKVKRGKAYTMQGWSSNNEEISVKTVNAAGEASWTTADSWGKNIGTDFTDIAQIFVESSGHAVGDTSLCGTYRFQLEAGEEGTEFEGYTGETYTPEADGSVEVQAISPTLTLSTDTEGVSIECDYNRDTNKAIAEMEATIGDINTVLASIVDIEGE